MADERSRPTGVGAFAEPQLRRSSELERQQRSQVAWAAGRFASWGLLDENREKPLLKNGLTLEAFGYTPGMRESENVIDVSRHPSAFLNGPSGNLSQRALRFSGGGDAALQPYGLANALMGQRPPERADTTGTAFDDRPMLGRMLGIGSGSQALTPQPRNGLLDPNEDAAAHWRYTPGSPWEASKTAQRVEAVLGAPGVNELLFASNFIAPRPGAAMLPTPTPKPQGVRAYHGSPHDFERFDLGKIGTGEGAHGTSADYPPWKGHAQRPDGMQALREAGIPGIRYKDAASRGVEGGTSNYVVSDDKLIEILRKYGLAGLMAGGAGAAQQSQPQQELQ